MLINDSQDRRMRLVVLVIGLIFLAYNGRGVAAEDWPRFRGPNGSGVSSSSNLPSRFGLDVNVRWKADSGQGISSPIIVGDNLLFTNHEGDKRMLHCWEASTGAPKWSQAVSKVRDERATKPAGPVTSTPASDGTNVYVFFPDVGLISYTLDGKQRWLTELPPFQTMHGVSSSLVVAENKVVLQADQQVDSYVAAFNTETGQLIWKVPRMNGLVGGFSTPAVLERDGASPQFILSGPLELAGYNARTGEKEWWLTGLTNAPVGVPVLAKGHLYICEPVAQPPSINTLAKRDANKDGKLSFGEVQADAALSRLLRRIEKEWGNGDEMVEASEFDKAFEGSLGNGGLASIKLGDSGDRTKTNVRWNYRKTVSYIPSVLVYGNVLYFVRDGGIVTAIDAESGEVAKQGRLTDAAGQYYSSPVGADGKVFFINTEGKMSVVTADRQWEIITSTDLDEPTWATPAISAGKIYVRTQSKIYCFSKP